MVDYAFTPNYDTLSCHSAASGVSVLYQWEELSAGCCEGLREARQLA